MYKDLKLADRARIIGLAVKSGITDLRTIETQLAPNATEVFTVTTSLDVSAGNEYQGKQYKLKLILKLFKLN